MTVKPEWLRVKAPQWERVGNVKDILRDLQLKLTVEPIQQNNHKSKNNQHYINDFI